MSRDFNGSTDYIDTSAGSLAIDQATTGITLVAVAKWDTLQADGLFHIVAGSGSDEWGIGCHSASGELRMQAGGDGNPRTSTGYLTTGQWYLVAATCASGTATPRLHKWDGTTWTHTDAGFTVSQTTVASPTGRLGRTQSSAYHDGPIAAAAVFNSSLSDANLETITGIQSLIDLGAVAVWRLNQADVGTSVDDLAGTSDQTTRSGTTVSADEPTFFSYTLDSEQPAPSSGRLAYRATGGLLSGSYHDETATVRAQEIDGQWTTLGTGRLRGITHEGLALTWNEWGPDSCTFTLKAAAGVLRPDVAPFTPVEVEIGGVIVWAGRTIDVPTSDTDHAVRCEGWQYHLDDQVYERAYVLTRFDRFRDQRSYLAADLTYYRVAPRAEVSGGAVSIVFPDGYVIDASQGVAATLDFGPESHSWPKRVVLAWERVGSSNADLTFLVRASTSENANGGTTQDLSTVALSTASGTVAATVTTVKRHIHLMVYLSGSPPVTPTTDIGVRVTSMLATSDAAWESSNTSVLRSVHVVSDALTYAPMLDQTTPLLETSTFLLPEYETGGYITPRQAIEQANAYESWQARLTGPDLRMLQYRAKPTAAVLEIGEWSGCQFQDGSVTGVPVFNQTIVAGQGPSGSAVVRRRATADLAGVTFDRLSSVQLSNPGADTNTTGWTATNGAIARETSIVYEGAGSFKLSSTGGSGGEAAAETTSLDGQIVAGFRYELACFARRTANMISTDNLVVRVYDGATGDFLASDTKNATELTTTSWLELACEFNAPPSRSLRVTLTAIGLGTSDLCYVDAIQLRIPSASLPDRREIVRARTLPIRSAVTEAVADRFGELWLSENHRAPFSGTATITGDGCRRVLGGATLPPYLIGLYTGEKLRVSHRVDPDTGALGRDGRIVAVSYDHNSRAATVQMDDRRGHFERVLSRYGILAG